MGFLRAVLSSGVGSIVGLLLGDRLSRVGSIVGPLTGVGPSGVGSVVGLLLGNLPADVVLIGVVSAKAIRLLRLYHARKDGRALRVERIGMYQQSYSSRD